MRATRQLLPMTIAAGLLLTAVAAPAAAAAPTSALPTRVLASRAVPAAARSGNCHVWFPKHWTRIGGSGSELADRLRRGGLSTATERRWATGMSHRHDLFVVADDSGRTSPTHTWTSATLDCMTQHPEHSRQALKDSLRRDLQRQGAHSVTLTGTRVAGTPAERASWSGANGRMGVRIRSLGGYSSTFGFTTDRSDYLHKAARTFSTLRF